MLRYIGKRCASMILIVIAAAFVIFTILYFTPGSPARAMLGSSATADEVLYLSTQLGLEDPYIVQLGRFFSDVFLHFDFGESWVFGVPVFDELMTRIPRTMTIAVTGMIINIGIGLLLGVYAGTHANQWQDRATMVTTMVFISCPNFFIALMMVLLFSAKLRWLPAYGIDDGFLSYVLPIAASAIGPIAINARQTRSSMLEVFRSDYIVTARAKGQKENKVVFGHMLPNALMPVITTVGGVLAHSIAGSPVIETIFSIPGIGTYMLTAVNNRDYPVLRSCVMFFAVFTAVVMLLTDLVYAFVDPRIKAQYSGGKRK